MGRFVLNKAPDAAGGGIISSAIYDAKKTAANGSSANSWTYPLGDNLCRIKVMRADPIFDIEYNVSSDHQGTWDSHAYRLNWWWSNQGTASWNGPYETRIYTCSSCWNEWRSVMGKSHGTGGLWQPTARKSGGNFQPGDYLRFAIQQHGDNTGTNANYVNQQSENLAGGSDRGDEWQGGGWFIRVRELDPNAIPITRDGPKNDSA